MFRVVVLVEEVDGVEVMLLLLLLLQFLFGGVIFDISWSIIGHGSVSAAGICGK